MPAFMVRNVDNSSIRELSGEKQGEYSLFHGGGGGKLLALSYRGDSRARAKTLKSASPLTVTSPFNVSPNEGQSS